MKRILFIISILFIGVAQSQGQAKLTANIESFDFGQIEWNKPVTVEYTITNAGDSPLLIGNVTTSCGCAVAKWPNHPIQPSEKEVISVEFDAKTLGQFYKEVCIYSNSTPNLVYLNFIGEVVREITDFSNSHPYKIGDIRLDNDSINFGDVLIGEEATFTLSVVNESDSPYKPILMHIPPYLQVEASDYYLEKGQRGEFEITFNTNEFLNYGLFSSELYLSRFIGDKVGKENTIPFSLLLLPNPDEEQEAFGIEYPEMDLDTNRVNISADLDRRNKVNNQFYIKNIGNANLEIVKLQTFSPAVQLKLNKAVVKPGEQSRLRVTVDKRKLISDDDNLDILLITNDRNHAKTIIKIEK